METAEALSAISKFKKGVWVRIDAEATNHPSQQHKGYGRLLSIEGNSAIVLPAPGHKKQEKIAIALLSLWKSRTAQVNGLPIDPSTKELYFIGSPEGFLWTGKRFGGYDEARPYPSKSRARQALSMMKVRKVHHHLEQCDILTDEQAIQWDETCKQQPVPITEVAPVAPTAPIAQPKLAPVAEPQHEHRPPSQLALTELVNSKELHEAYVVMTKTAEDFFAARDLMVHSLKEMAKARSEFFRLMDKELGLLGIQMDELTK